MRTDKLTKKDFLEISFNFISLIIENVSEIKLLKTVPKNSPTNKIYSLLKKIINNHDFNNFYKKYLYRKTRSPIYFASICTLIYFRYYYGLVLQQKKYIQILNKLSEFNLNYSTFTSLYKAITSEFFKTQEQKYSKKGLIKKKLYHHNRIYEFKFLNENIKNIENSSLKTQLLNYFNNIIAGNFPTKFFEMSIGSSRASRLYLKGCKDFKIYHKNYKHLKSADYNLYDRLIRKMRHKFYDSNFILCKYARRIKNLCEEDPFKDFGHDPVLNEILFNFKNTLAIELPTWKKFNLTNEIITGHIDLTYFDKNCLYITDFKQTIEEIYRSLPQVAAYGNLILERVNNRDFDVKCISFNHEIAIEFPPDILGNEILNFVMQTNNIRKSYGLTALKTRDNMGDLENEIKKFIP